MMELHTFKPIPFSFAVALLSGMRAIHADLLQASFERNMQRGYGESEPRLSAAFE